MHELQEEQKVLIIRYGKKNNCIEMHNEVIVDKGYCWFGKIGVVPSKKSVDAVFAEEYPKVVLYSQGKGYIADISEIVYEKPKDGYPEYYVKELFDKQIYPKCYFKICSLKLITNEDFLKLKVVSSGNLAIETLNRSMSSFFFAEYGRTKSTIIDEKKNKRVKKKRLDINDCQHRKNGKCNKKGFVNFDYECERASTCIGQKR